MDTIRQYIDSLFSNYEESEEGKQAKAHLMEMAEDKYYELRQDGMGIDEAVAKVIAELGSMDELEGELSPKEEKVESVVDVTQIMKLLEDYHTAALLIALACGCIALTALPLTVMEGVIVPILIVGLIATSIVLVVIQNAITVKWYEVKHQKIQLSDEAKKYVVDEKEKKGRFLLTLKCIGIFALIGSLVPLLMDIKANVGLILAIMMTTLGVCLIAYSVWNEKNYNSILGFDPYGEARNNVRTLRWYTVVAMFVVGLGLSIITYQFWLTLILGIVGIAGYWFSKGN